MMRMSRLASFWPPASMCLGVLRRADEITAAGLVAVAQRRGLPVAVDLAEAR